MTEMTEAGAVPVKTAMPSFWEDAIEIFFHPTAVLRRRKDTSVWPPLLFVAIVMGVLTFATFNTLAPVFEAEFARNSAKAMAQNPQLKPEQMEKMRDMGMNITKFTFPIIMMVSMFVVGLVSWLLSKAVSATTTFNQALTIAAWAYFPRILSSIAGGVQGLLMDPAKLNSALSISLSPARFMDVETANPILYQLMGRFDVTIIWETILLAIGIYVSGKVTKNQAIVFGVLIWLIGSLPAIRTGYMLM